MRWRLERKLAKTEGTQEFEEITSEKWRGRMAHATARRSANRSDAAAWFARPRGLESASDVSAWMTRARDMCDLHNLQNSLGAILDLISAQFLARNSRLESENMQKQHTHSFSSFRSSFTLLGFSLQVFRILILNWSEHWNIEKSYFPHQDFVILVRFLNLVSFFHVLCFVQFCHLNTFMII